MPTDHTGPALQVRVYIGPGSPLHGILSALPAASRAAALVRLAEAHTPEATTDRLAVATERLAAETARVAQALQALAAGSAPVPRAPADPADAAPPKAEPDPEAAATDRALAAWGLRDD